MHRRSRSCEPSSIRRLISRRCSHLAYIAVCKPLLVELREVAEPKPPRGEGVGGTQRETAPQDAAARPSVLPPDDDDLDMALGNLMEMGGSTTETPPTMVQETKPQPRTKPPSAPPQPRTKP